MRNNIAIKSQIQCLTWKNYDEPTDLSLDKRLDENMQA